ncbi:hypothetical protein ADUPG1_011450 [Aduncisulcus paluster]|uniref:Uncharacterized protein n=1 Tax=Aduncisulcus paluster TaxID=2918883 RepID=A0ABQ5JWK3_9EUKA|nr:hypothetical protein ADUPG1_011450 [Aduncisulcus paluster]
MSSSTDAVIQTVEPLFVHEGDEACCPIPGDAPNIKSTKFPTIKAIAVTNKEGDKKSDQSYYAQRMIRGVGNRKHFTHISIPFSSSSPMKGAYICLDGDSSPPSHLIFTFTSSKGDKTSKKYKFPEFKGYHWYFLPVDLPDVVLCKIKGKGREEKYFGIIYLVFIREETPEELKSRKAREKLWSEAPVVKPEFVKGEDVEYIDLPCDDPHIVDPTCSLRTLAMVKCKNDSVRKGTFLWYDQSVNAQKMLRGGDYVWLSHLSIPFRSPSPMKGAYICVHQRFSPPSLLFTFTDCDGKKTFKKYEFTRPKHNCEWHFLPIDLDNVGLCEIEGKGRWYKKNSRCFRIESLFFLEEETPEEIKAREAKDKLWSEAPVVKPEFVKVGGIKYIPIPRDNPKLIDPSFSMVKSHDDEYVKGHIWYDRSSEAQKMLKGVDSAYLSHLSIPFPSPNPMKGAYICVRKDYSSPSLLFTFTDCAGKKINKKYEFTRPKHKYEWHFLPIDLDNVVLCEIKGKGTWSNRDAVSFDIDSLVFTINEETIAADRLSLLPWK